MSAPTCPCCKQALPVPCLVRGCEAETHANHWRETREGYRYRNYKCVQGHRFIVTAKGVMAFRYSRVLDGYIPKTVRPILSAEHRV